MELTQKARQAIKKAALVEGRTEEQMLYLLLAEAFNWHWVDKDAAFSHMPGCVEFSPKEISEDLEKHAFSMHH